MIKLDRNLTELDSPYLVNRCYTWVGFAYDGISNSLESMVYVNSNY